MAHGLFDSVEVHCSISTNIAIGQNYSLAKMIMILNHQLYILIKH